jgi:predicted MFS family arabinose efflux permease
MNAQASAVVLGRSTATARRPGALYWLALGTFAIGTEGFMIAALLMTIATDIRVSVAQAGRNLGFVGAMCELAALTLLLVNQARDVRSQSEHVASPDRQELQNDGR